MAEEKLEFRIGGFCRLKEEAIARMDSTPARMYRDGWPNWFAIDQIYEDEKEGMLLKLDPCCEWMEDLADRTKHACKAHPAKNFEPIPGHLKDQVEGSGDGEENRERGTGPSGGRYAGFALGEDTEDIIGVEFVNGGKVPAIIVRRAGKAPEILKGSPALKIGKVLHGLGIL